MKAPGCLWHSISINFSKAVVNFFFYSLQTGLFGSTTTSAPTGLFGTQSTGFGQTQSGTGLFGQTPGFGQTQQQVGIKMNNYISALLQKRYAVELVLGLLWMFRPHTIVT